MPTISINKLLKTSCNTADKKKYIYLHTIWDDEEVNIKILDSENGKYYKGAITATGIKEKASDLDMSYNDYYEEIRLALTTYMTLPNFYYKLEEKAGVLNVWKKLQPDTIPILFLDIDIKEVQSNYDLLDCAVDLLRQKDEILSERIQKAHKFDEHSRELLEDYRSCVEEKKDLERKLFKKVAVLLNAKKERIMELEERLRKYEEVEENEEKSDTDENEGPKINKKRRFMVIESESDSDDYIADTQPLDFPNSETNKKN